MLNTFFQKQQLIMTMLGYYSGKCDGIWGPKCVEAKRKWEYEDNFEPAVPSNGLPFTGRGKLPKGMSYIHNGLDIMWSSWDQARADAILDSDHGTLLTAQHVSDHVLGESTAPVVAEPAVVSRGTPEVQPKVSTLSAVPAQPEPEESSSVQAEEKTEEVEEDSTSESEEQEETSTEQSQSSQDWLSRKKRK